MKRIFLPLLLSSAIASADVLTGLSVASQLFHLKEHNPDNDINNLTAKTAASIIAEFL